MNFCSACGNAITQQIPAGDNRLRDVCDDCGMIHYSNPNNVCGAILTWKGKILLCKRAIEPRSGFWTLPAGFMENGETIAQAAARESMEEANAEAQSLRLFGVFSLPHISQIYLMFQGELKTDQIFPGTESLQTELFEVDDIPWDELAFPVITHCLNLYIDHPENKSVHTATAIRHEDRHVDWIDQTISN